MTSPELKKMLSLCLRAIRAAELIGVDLTEQVVKKLRTELPFSTSTLPTVGYFTSNRDNETVPNLNFEEIHAGLNTSKLDAVKAYKNRTGLSLLTSKWAVEQYFQDHNLRFYKQPY
jgi:hypothetical protein